MTRGSTRASSPSAGVPGAYQPDDRGRCSRTGRTTPARIRSRRPSRRPTAGSASTRSATGPRPAPGSRRRAGAQFIGNEPGGRNFGGGWRRRWWAGFGGSGGFRRGIDEDTLKAIAELTGGTYSPAESASELGDVFADLPTTLITKREPVEVTVGFVALGGLLAGLGLLLGRAWRPLP